MDSVELPEMRVQGEKSTSGRELLQLTMDIWHPNCWTLFVTERHNVHILAHGSYRTVESKVKGRFTVLADTNEEVEEAVGAIEGSPLTEEVFRLHDGFAKNTSFPPGNAAMEIFVEYPPENSIDSEFSSRGFIREKPIRIADGIETWAVAIHATRQEMQLALDGVAEAMDAEIDVTQITTNQEQAEASTPSSLLSERQREAFKLARERNYYEWPREVTAKELAAEFGLSKTTYLEHLRKAEAKLLNQPL